MKNRNIAILIIWALLLIPALSWSATITATWDTPAQNSAGGTLTDAEKAAVVTVIEAGTLTTDYVLSWLEVGRSDPGKTLWKGDAPEKYMALRAKHVLNGLSSGWSVISATMNPSGFCITK